MMGLYLKKIKDTYFSEQPKITLLIVFTLIVFSRGELPVDKKCELSTFLWV